MTNKRPIILVGCVLFCCLFVSQSIAATGKAKNIIFFLGDGMGPTTVTAARIYRYGEAGQLNMESLEHTARIKTYSLDAQTTDSATSMSAYMTGIKARNDVISMSSDTHAFDARGKKYASGSDTRCPLASIGAASSGTAAVTLLELSKAAGKVAGAVTTARITHATPAATFAHLCNRDGENDIAAQLTPGSAQYNRALYDGVDVLLGGGMRHFIPKDIPGSKRTDQSDLIALFKKAGYTVVSTRAALAAVNPAQSKKLIGLFNLNHMQYELDRVKHEVNEPSLAEMTEKAIQLLARHPNGFFLMIEGGRIDHALHQTNAKRALEDTIAFDEAIKRALSIVDLSNTLIVVTADHDHTMTFNGYSHRSNPILGKVTDFKTKQLAMAADGKPFTALVFGNGAGPRQAVRKDLTMIDTQSDDFQQAVGVAFSPRDGQVHEDSETHGGGDVMLFSTGPGSAFFKGTLDNTQVFNLIKMSLGL